MCQLATVYCDFITKATIDGQLRNLRDEPNGHHDFVYGQTDVFPQHVENYLKSIGHKEVHKYRARAIKSRKQNSQQSTLYYYSQMRPTERKFVNCATDTVIADPFATPEDWREHVVKLAQMRASRIIERLKTKDVVKLTAQEKEYIAAKFPQQWTEYCAVIAALDGPLPERAKHRYRAQRALKERLRMKGRALAKRIRQAGCDDLVARTLASVVPTKQPMAMAA